MVFRIGRTNTSRKAMTMTAGTPKTLAGERADLLATLAQHRHFLRFTVRDLTDEQAGLHTTVSELCLGGIIKHVAAVERAWVDFILGGAAAMKAAAEEGSATDWQDRFKLLPGETLVVLLDRYESVAGRTDELVASLADLDDSQALPEAPWFEKGARWSARRVLLHIIGETAQHAGHADIIREALDGSKTMG
jgi:uncharacterized damage-inducible protein DinB